MPAEPQQTKLITTGNTPDTTGNLLDHILADVHEILSRLSAFEAEARPLLDAYKRTNGGTIGLLRAKKAARGG